MGQDIELYFLQGFDNNKSKKIAATLSFMASRIGLQLKISIIENFNREIKPNQVVLIELDEITLEHLAKNQSSVSFLSNHQKNDGKVIIILDDVQANQIPEYLSLAHTFYLFSADNLLSPDEPGIISAPEPNLMNVLHDVVHYIKFVNHSKNEGFRIFFAPPDIEEHAIFQATMRETMHREFEVLPLAINPTAKKQLLNNNSLIGDLNKANLSIHFISHNALLNFPEHLSPSLEVNKKVAEYCHRDEGKNLQRIIYIPAEDENASELVSRKIALFKNDSYHLKNAELVQIPVEKLKNIITTKYIEWLNPAKKTKNKIIGNGTLYFIYPPGCDHKVESYLNWFNQNNIPFSKSQIGLDQLELLQYHQEMLTKCHGVLIYNDGNEEWLSRKLSDLIKSPGWGRVNPFKYKVILGEPVEKKIEQSANDQKLIILTGETNYKQLKEVIEV